jgi:hypothetical protein
MTPSLIISDQTRSPRRADIFWAATVGIIPMPSCSVVPSVAKAATRSPIAAAPSSEPCPLGEVNGSSTSTMPSIDSRGISPAPNV